VGRIMPTVQEFKEYGFKNRQSFVVSVIIVTYGPRKDALKACLDCLQSQTVHEFEVVLVENGSNHLSEELAGNLKLKHIILDRNYCFTLARNVGAYYADSEILIFLDDDAIPAPDLIEAHVKSYGNSVIVGVRGKCLPATDKHNPYNTGSYDLGEELIPAPLHLEGNCSIKRANFIKAGGWSTSIMYAHEGLALTYELTQGGKLYERTIYNPRAVIFHDNNKTIAKSLYLSFVMGRNIVKLERVYPDLKSFMRIYDYKPAIPRKKEGLRQKLAWKNLIDALLAYLHDSCRDNGSRYEKISRLITGSAEPCIVDLNFFTDWPLSREMPDAS